MVASKVIAALAEVMQFHFRLLSFERPPVGCYHSLLVVQLAKPVEVALLGQFLAD